MPQWKGVQKTIITLNKESYGEGGECKAQRIKKAKKEKKVFLKNKTKQKKPKDMMAETHRLSPNPTCHLES